MQLPDSPKRSGRNSARNATQHNVKAVSVFEMLQSSSSDVLATNKHDGRGTNVVLVIPNFFKSPDWHF